MNTCTWALWILIVCQYEVFVYGDCPPPVGANPDQHPVIDFVPVNPDDYDKNYTSIETDGRRPFGYMKGTVYFNQNMPNPCVRISGASTKRVEIMAETDPETKLCLRDQTTSTTSCFPHQYYKCMQSPDGNVYIEFLCDAGCSENDVTFWYRLAVSPPPSELDPETWCANRDGDEYPSSLMPFDPNNPAYSRPTTTLATSAATKTIFQFSLVSILACIVSYLTFHLPSCCTFT